MFDCSILFSPFLLLSRWFRLFLSLPKNKQGAFNSQDLISSSLYCLPYSSCGVSSENYLVLDQLIIPLMIFFFILITYLLDIVLIL